MNRYQGKLEFEGFSAELSRGVMSGAMAEKLHSLVERMEMSIFARQRYVGPARRSMVICTRRRGAHPFNVLIYSVWVIARVCSSYVTQQADDMLLRA
jgi:hypothetical protein